MPRRGENIYKRKDGRWEGRQLKIDGKYQYFYGKSYREVKDSIKSYQENGNKIKKEVKTLASVSSLFELWLDSDLVKRIKPSTYESYYHCVTKYIIPFYTSFNYSQLTEDTVSEFVKFMHNDNSISQSYKRKILAVYKTALREILKNNPDSVKLLNYIKFPKPEQNEVQVFTMKEQCLIEKAVLSCPDKRTLGILLCFYSGIRLGELCALKWCDFDFENETLFINRTVTRTKNFTDDDNKTLLLIGTPKSRTSSRKIPLPSFLITIFREYYLLSGKDNCYFMTGSETPIDPRAFQKLYKKILIKTGVPDRKFHAIRHTFATRALELNVDIKTISDILGHSNVSITMNIYAHSLMEQKKIAIDRFNNMHIASMETGKYAVTNPVREEHLSSKNVGFWCI
ncbi:tyrosine-type recombinase/integrase [Lacrimispora defluvii]|uniref:Site-specific integrase n=1 Tax=Lacrimispora defluvii TaxID=2719233 RepID=A0ABX1VRM5_9FIRM|nr:site-specific integrase [Lacrimispora defluvii]NNJ31078.1 site-specific integrase [Lacrimispora defluvii]